MKSLLYFRSHAICQLKILKERVGTGDNASTTSSPSPYGMKTPDFSDDEMYYENHDQLGYSIVSRNNFQC